MLLDDERHVIKWLSQYGALTKTQVIRLLRDKTPETAEKILRNLKREHQISDVAGGYYLALDGLCKPDQRTILAVWVLLRFIDYVDPMAHYPAVYPSQIFFLKENTGYEIVVLYDGEQHLSKLLQPQDDEMKYIFVLPNIAMASQMMRPKAPCLFATVNFAGQKEPDITFYTEEAANMRISEKAKKTVSRKTFMAVVVSMMVCLLFVTPVFAASSFYSKTTTKLNAINGGKSTTSRLVE